MSDHLQIMLLSAPDAGSAYELSPGASVIVGRSVNCQIVVQDESLSRNHFRIAWDGVLCQLLDLDSTNGTWVNGEPVHEAILRVGDEVMAGGVRFRIEVAGTSESVPETPVSGCASQPLSTGGDTSHGGEGPLSAEDSNAEPLPLFEKIEPTLRGQQVPQPPENSLLAALLRATKPQVLEGRNLFAVIDGAQAIELAFFARMLGHAVVTLFEGDMAEQVAHAGPCLIALKPSDTAAFLQKWVGEIGRNAGILLDTPASLDELFHHLRDIFVVTDEEGQEYFFRYYDPRVFRTFLPTCEDSELREFFGVVSRWLVEAENGEKYESWSLGPNELAFGELAVPTD